MCIWGKGWYFQLEVKINSFYLCSVVSRKLHEIPVGVKIEMVLRNIAFAGNINL